MTKVSVSTRHFILAHHSGKFDVDHGAESPPVELRAEIVFEEESYQLGAIYKRKRHRMLSYHNQVTVYVNLSSIKWQQ